MPAHPERRQSPLLPPYELYQLMASNKVPLEYTPKTAAEYQAVRGQYLFWLIAPEKKARTIYTTYSGQAQIDRYLQNKPIVGIGTMAFEPSGASVYQAAIPGRGMSPQEVSRKKLHVRGVIQELQIPDFIDQMYYAKYAPLALAKKLEIEADMQSFYKEFAQSGRPHSAVEILVDPTTNQELVMFAHSTQLSPVASLGEMKRRISTLN